MTSTTLPINAIQILDRQRSDLGDLPSLAASIKTYGIIQPPIVNQDNRLIAGERRIRAAMLLGWTEIPVVYRETLSADEVHELELEENLKRKAMSWQEELKNLLTIYRIKKRRHALEGQKWGLREAAEELGIKGHSNLYNKLLLAECILNNDKEIIECENWTEAWRVIMRRQEEEGQALIAKQEGVQVGIPQQVNIDDLLDSSSEQITPLESLSVQPSIPTPEEKQLARERYLSNPHNPPDEFESYWQEKLASRSIIEQDRLTIPLSKMLYCCDSVEFMTHPDCQERFDHIITDIPYGIDMDMLNQQDHDKGMADISTVLAEHDVEENEKLFARFFPAAYSCLKPNSFLITWCDIMQWQLMYNLATSAGFKVQRWPITWVKTHNCMNQTANINFTKTTEIAMVCRKGTPTLARPNIPTHVIASHDSLKDKLGHPFVKPFAIWEHLISAVSLQNQLILEPFSGRGSGVISMLRLNRKVVGCELNTAHFNALVENIKTYYREINPNYMFE